MLISAAQLRLMSVSCDYTALAPLLDREAHRREITTPRRIAHWLAHLHVESAGYTRLEEDLYYSAPRLMAVWPSRFPDLAAAAPYANNPQGLANLVYGGRYGNAAPNDGWLYRGRSLIQVTFKANYALAQGWSGLPLVANPGLAKGYDAAATIAAAFWAAHGLNAIADADPGETAMSAFASIQAEVLGQEADDVAAEARVINGGLTGLQARVNMLIRARGIWRDAA